MNTPKIRFKGFKDDWEQRKLDTVAKFSKGSGYSKGDLIETGTPIILYGRLYTKYETSISDVDTYVEAKEGSVYSKGGEVIVPASGETAEDIARAATVDKSGILLGGDLNVVMPNEDINSAFLAISISNGNSQRELAKKAQGKSVVHIHNEEIRNLIVPFPIKAEQNRIVDYFSTLDHLITLHQRKCDETKQLKKFMLQKMFPKNGEKNPEIRFEGFTDAWEQRKLEDVAEFLDTMRKPLEGARRIPGPYPYYGASGIVDYVDGYLFNEELVLLSEDGANITDRNYPVCFLASGKYWVNNHAHVLRLKDGNENNFVCTSLERKDYKQYNSGMAMPKLNQEVCRRIPIGCPSFNEQKKIGDYFRELDNLITLHQRKCEKLKALKKFMLQNMFI